MSTINLGSRTERTVKNGRSPAAEDALSIVHVLAPAPFGGLERVVQSLTSGLTGRGHQVHVIAVLSPGPTEHPFVAALRDAGITVHALTLPGRAYREERRQVLDICRRVGADVIHTHGYRPDVLDSGVAGTLGIPRVSTVHGFTGGDLRNRLYEKLQLHFLRRFDAVVVVARPQIDRLESAGVPSSRVHLLPNAWQQSETLDPAVARKTLGTPDDAFHPGWVGRLSQEKGADVFIEALGRLGDMPFIASIIGDGPERETLEQKAAALGIAERVRFHGALPDAGRYFSGFDSFVLSSRTEGTPMVLFEAMACRTPIVATRVGGVPDVISGTEGLLVDSEDPDALAAAIRAVHDEPAAAARRAEHARARLETQFNLSSWLDSYESIYRNVINLRAQ